MINEEEARRVLEKVIGYLFYSLCLRNLKILISMFVSFIVH